MEGWLHYQLFCPRQKTVKKRIRSLFEFKVTMDPFLDYPPVSFDFWEVRDDVEPMFRSSQHYPPPRTPQYQSPHSSSSHFPPRTSDHYLRESGRRGEQLPPVKQ